MTATDFNTSIVVDQTASEVFNAINNVRGWWSEDINGGTDKLNDEFSYSYGDAHRCQMNIIEMVPNKKIVWLVLDNYFNFTKDKTEWNGNKIIFEISEAHNKTELQFTQEGLVPEYECYDICQNAWSSYIQKSLRNLITTGKGQPNIKTESSKPGYSTILLLNQSPQEVFAAVNNVRGWWQGEIQGSSDKIGDEFTYQMEEFHYSKQKVVEFIPNKKVVLLVTESQLNFIEEKNEWDNTKIIFEISEINNKTELRFTHEGLIPEVECYDACSNGWSQLIHKSLFSFINTGKGKKVF
jgi:hypothetical protein